MSNPTAALTATARWAVARRITVSRRRGNVTSLPTFSAQNRAELARLADTGMVHGPEHMRNVYTAPLLDPSHGLSLLDLRHVAMGGGVHLPDGSLVMCFDDFERVLTPGLWVDPDDCAVYEIPPTVARVAGTPRAI